MGGLSAEPRGPKEEERSSLLEVASVVKALAAAVTVASEGTKMAFSLAVGFFARWGELVSEPNGARRGEATALTVAGIDSVMAGRSHEISKKVKGQGEEVAKKDNKRRLSSRRKQQNDEFLYGYMV